MKKFLTTPTTLYTGLYGSKKPQGEQKALDLRYR